ncbi:MAG: DUF4125 family protein [Bacteroidales bacterium]|nr:DUF4125 family protein [Bacteroidales bacterium]MDY0285276.1 DUF4125 family protein [Bacteroidales bacterium]
MQEKQKTTDTNRKWDVIDQIVAKELEMFLQVRATDDGTGKACQEEPNMFKAMRWMSHSVLSLKTLESYLSDLNSAAAHNRNLMTEKYALMDNLIPHPTLGQDLILEIAAKEVQWMQEVQGKYPGLIQGKTAEFTNYLVCEYETYSFETLTLLLDDIHRAETKELNLPELRYRNLFKRLGYSSIEEAQKHNSSEQ